MDNFDTSPASLSGQAFVYNSVYASSLIILYYEYLLTFPEELARYWIGRRKASLAWFLFCLNRYFAFLGHIPLLIKLFWHTSDSRHIQVNVSLEVPSDKHEFTIGQVIIGICLLLRTYALYGRTRLMLAFLCTIAAVEMFYVVTLQTFRGDRSNILSIMLRDGTIYFGVIIITAIVGIIDFALFPLYVRGVTATMGNVLASTMVSRLMLNLRDPKFGPTGGSEAQSTTQIDFGNRNPVNATVTTSVNNPVNTTPSDWI
ncbi:hypothetical protein GALMADRAFT_145353 [Galerina marginata CBS 339.88]|uniref:DUF6533 domain-containing protein n=1 Tax=Galerina marginata (strain CBS 339.88) TaxID=685588 RepID=A0A067SFA3_GALM3|nr:hypothetical protein GALMADRAFT_145353 [Galerina marginata CBS 339.88]